MKLKLQRIYDEQQNMIVLVQDVTQHWTVSMATEFLNFSRNAGLICTPTKLYQERAEYG